MANRFDDFIKVLNALEKHRVEYILIGGVAVILHGLERLTRDIDLFVKMDTDNIARLQQALKSVFDDPSIDEISNDELQKYPVVRYGTPDGFFIDDVMSRIGDVFNYDDLEYEIVEYEGTQIRIATPATLYELKKDTIRPQDKMDAAFFKELIKQRKVEK